MAFLKSKLFIVTAISTTVVGIAGVATASVGGGDILMGLINKQFLSFLPPELNGIVGQNGQINLEKAFPDLSKKGFELSTQPTSGQTAGGEYREQIQNAIETAQQANNKSYNEGLDDFKQSAQKTEEVVTKNEKPAESTLEGTNKSNELNSLLNTNIVRQTKAINDLTGATQITNTHMIAAGQKETTESLKAEIREQFAADEIERGRAMINNRFYPDGNGGVAK